jgi:tetratricopeptide (TPR) repeat protein
VLGSEYFDYTVRSGESLSLIAERYLGDPLEFYILARYNGIDNPSRLDVNQTIRVPGTPPAPPPADKVADTTEPTVVPAPETQEQTDTAPEADIEDTEQEDTAETPGSASVDFPVARLLYLNGDYAGAIRILENANVDEASRELLVKSYTAYARELVTQGRLAEARSVMASASALEPTNQELIDQLADIDDRIEANLLVDEGLAQMQANDLTGAYKSFNEALVYEPDHPEATRQLTSVKQGLIEGYLEEAEAAFEQEDIDQAIDFWDKVLELDPDNQSASTSRSTALKAKHAAEKE